MSLLKSLGLIKEDPSSPVVPQATAPIQTPTPTRTSGRRRASAPDESEDVEATNTAPTDKDMEKRLRKAVNNSGTDGFDFVNLIQMIAKSKSLDEESSYTAALTAADTMGVGVEELVSGAQNAIKAVNNESKKIDADLAEQAEKTAQAQAELKKVNAQLAQLTSRKETLEENIKNGSATVEESQRSLESTVEVVVSEIKEVVAKIKKYSK